jgi:hypothetical protein
VDAENQTRRPGAPPNKPHIEPLLVDAQEAATLLAISPRTLWARSFPRGPIPIVKIPGTRAVRYSLAALQAFIEAAQEGGQS